MFIEDCFDSCTEKTNLKVLAFGDALKNEPQIVPVICRRVQQSVDLIKNKEPQIVKKFDEVLAFAEQVCKSSRGCDDDVWTFGKIK